MLLRPARSRDHLVSRLRPERPRQQRFDCRVDAEPAVQHCRDRRGDRHFDPAGIRHIAEYRGREHAFRQLAALRFFERAAFPERDPQREIPRLPARAGKDQIAEAGKAGEGLRLGAEGLAEAHELGEARRPSTMPAAIASTFLAAPPISTPRKSVE